MIAARRRLSTKPQEHGTFQPRPNIRLDRPPNTPNNGTIVAKMRAALLDEDDARLKAARMAHEFLTYLGSLRARAGGYLRRAACRRVLHILSMLKIGDAGLARQIRHVAGHAGA